MRPEIKRIRKAICLLLVAIFIMNIMPVRAEAATVKAYQYVTASSLAGRTGPGTTYAQRTTFRRGTRLWVEKTLGSWSRVTTSKTSTTYYWVSSSYLSSKNPSSGKKTGASGSFAETAVNKYMYVTASSSLNGRSGPGQNYAVRRAFPHGKKLWVASKSNNWYKVAESKSSKTYYWVSSNYMNAQDQSSGTKTGASGTSAKTTETAVKKYMYVTIDSLNARSGPGTSYASKTSFSRNKKLWVVSKSNNWYKVAKSKSSKTYYWVYATYMSQSKPAGDAEAEANKTKPVKKDMYVNIDSLNVRKGPGTSYAVVTSYAKGTKVWVESEKNGWYKISKGYWVSKNYMSQSKPAGTSKVPSIKKMAPLAQKYGKKYGICPSVILAWYINENGLKANNLTLHHNYFGMASYGSLKDYTGVTKPAWASYKTETVLAMPHPNGTTYDAIKTYRSVADSVEDFCAVMRRHYPALGRTKDPAEEAKLMAGYLNRKDDTIISCINYYDLTQYD